MTIKWTITKRIISRKKNGWKNIKKSIKREAKFEREREREREWWAFFVMDNLEGIKEMWKWSKMKFIWKLKWKWNDWGKWKVEQSEFVEF